MLASGCGPSPHTKARNSCRWTCNSPLGDAFACRCRWQHPAAADKASPVAEPWFSPLRADGSPQVASSERDGAAIDVARRRKQRRYAELARPGPQRLVVLAAEVGGRWGPEAHDLVRHLVRQRSLRAPQALRAAARAGWARRWWGQLGCALQRALASTLLGDVWRAPAQPAGADDVPLGRVLELAEAEQPSRLPLQA